MLAQDRLVKDVKVYEIAKHISEHGLNSFEHQLVD